MQHVNKKSRQWQYTNNVETCMYTCRSVNTGKQCKQFKRVGDVLCKYITF